MKAKKEYPKPSLTADIVVLSWRGGVPHVLLGRRSHATDAFPGYWAIPGGFVNAGETTKAAASRELREETGLEEGEPSPLGFFDDPSRDPRGWVVSMAYLLDLGTREVKPKAGDDLKIVDWFPLDQLPAELAFDHAEILAVARRSVHW